MLSFLAQGTERKGKRTAKRKASVPIIDFHIFLVLLLLAKTMAFLPRIFAVVGLM